MNTVGPDWGAGVIQSSAIAFAVSLLLIIAYIAIRFEYKMGIMAVVALLHDLIIVVGIYALVGREITPNMVAALLTILGYSLYDTVVVFHRINDNMKESSLKCTFMSMANHSINQVFIRTINTTFDFVCSGIWHAYLWRRNAERLRIRYGSWLDRGFLFVHCGCYTALCDVENTRGKECETGQEIWARSSIVYVRINPAPVSKEEAQATVAAGEASADKKAAVVETKAKEAPKTNKRNNA